MKNPDIYISGEISDESYVEFAEAFTKLYINPKVRKITISITSEGGNAYSALAYYDLITQASTTKPVITIATGLVASAASLIFMAGTERHMTKNAWLMVHEDTVSGVEDMKVSQIEKEAAHGRRLENQWCTLMQEATGIEFSTWKALHEKETFLDVTDCVNMGICRRIE